MAIGTAIAAIALHPFISAGVAAGIGVLASEQMDAQEDAQNASIAFAEEQQKTALAEQQRLEEKYGLTPGELAREEGLFGGGSIADTNVLTGQKIELGLEQKQQAELERRAGLTGEELLKEAGPVTTSLIEKIASRSGMTGEELFTQEGAINKALQEEILRGAEKPGATYEDTLQQQLELSRQMVNAEANKRGVFGGLPEGGIRFEQLGRAGVDLAIKSASERQSARQTDLANAATLANIFSNLSAGARAEAGTVGESALTQKTKARDELAQFLANIQNLVAQSKGREAQVATGASASAQQAVSQAYGAKQETLGLQSGQAAAGIGAIGDIAGTVIGEGISSMFPQKDNTLTINMPGINGEEEDAYADINRLLERSGGSFNLATSPKASSLRNSIF